MTKTTPLLLVGKKPERLEAMFFIGGKENANEVLDWMAEKAIVGGWMPDGALLADPNCPTPEYHETHHYCPSCPFKTNKESIHFPAGDKTTVVEVNNYIVYKGDGLFCGMSQDEFTHGYNVLDVIEPVEPS